MATLQNITPAQPSVILALAASRANLWKTLRTEGDIDVPDSEFEKDRAVASVILGITPKTPEEAMALLETIIGHMIAEGEAQENGTICQCSDMLLTIFHLLCPPLNYESTIFYDQAAFDKNFPGIADKRARFVAESV